MVPLTLDDAPCVALPYAHRTFAYDAARSGRVAFVAGPEVLTGVVELIEDVSGELFNDRLLMEELLKYPPSRALADSLLLQRENWWWVPRLILRLSRVEATERLESRVAGGPLLVRPGPTVQALESADDVPKDLDGPVHVFGHSYSAPDMERWEAWHRRGSISRGAFMVDAAAGDPSPDLSPLPLGERLRRHRELERACRRGIREAERGR